MSLEEGVRAAVHDLATSAPVPVDLAGAARVRGRKIRRRRRAGMAAAAMALVAVAVTPYAIGKRHEAQPAPVGPTPVPSVATTASVRQTAAAKDWAKAPLRLPGGAIMTALTRRDVGAEKSPARTLQSGNVVLDRATGRYVALRGDYYTVWGAPKVNQGVVSDGGNGLGILHADGGIRWVRIGYTLEPQWSPDGTRLLVSTLQGYAVIDAATGRVTRHAVPGAMAACPDECLFTWLPDGKRVAIARRDLTAAQSEAAADTIREVTVYDSATAKVVRTLPVPGVPISGAAWSPDGRRVLVQAAELGGRGRRLVDTTTGKIIKEIPYENARFLAGGQILGLSDELATLYDADGTVVEVMTLPRDFKYRVVSAS